jgi:hypothetical protein
LLRSPLAVNYCAFVAQDGLTFKLKMQTCCPRCGALMRVIARIEKPDIIDPILNHLNRWRISYRPVYRANVRSGLRFQPVDATPKL